MKAKTMLGLIACASACVSLSAFGNETNGWFGVKVENAEIVHPNCATNGAAVTIDGSAIKLEDASLVIDHFAEAPTSDDIVKIAATALLTPSSTNDFADVSDQSKAGFAVGIDDQDKTNFYGYANGVWHKLSGTPGDGETSIFNLASGANGLNGINASGSGSITSVTGAYEVAVAAYGDKKYGSIAEASDAVKAASAADPTATVQVVNSDGTTEPADALAANGLRKIVCEALGLPMNDSTANIAVAPVATDDDSGNITLELTLSNVTEPDAVGFVVSGSDTKYDADGIKIPLTAGTYTITPVLK